MKNKIIAVLLSVTAVYGNIIPVSAADDYSQQLGEIKSLLDICAGKGISTDYESINYYTMDKFVKYLAEDEANGAPDEQLEYNRNAMTELYNETVSNLNAYIDGTKTPYAIDYPDMGNLTVSGSTITDGKNPVYSVGYGHFGQAREDVIDFDKFGADNIQIEIGPTDIESSIAGWNDYNVGNCDGSISIDTENYTDGSRSIKFVNNSEKASNVYMYISRYVYVKPNTSYTMTFDCKGKGVNGFYATMNSWDGRVASSAISSWRTKTLTYTTTADQSKLHVFMLVDNVTESLYIDNITLKESGSNVNLLEEVGSFESDKYHGSAWYVYDTLKRAEENNVAVTLLLSPHYFPENLSDNLYSDNGGSVGFNVDEPEAREVIENHIRTVLSGLDGYGALSSICLSNEPTYNTRGFADFYNPKFREYIKEKHGTISAVNSTYGLSDGFFGFGKTSYDSFDDIKMPSSLGNGGAIAYDWIEFNDRVLTDWHKWMADIVHEYLPDIPVHSKILPYIFNESDSKRREYLSRGVDLEMFDEFSTFAGNDNYGYISNPDSYYIKMMYYDYLSSATGKPVYNSEDHVISDDDEVYSELQLRHAKNSLLQGALHGCSMSSLWVWERAYNGILFRPDVVAGIGKTHLDMIRLSEEIDGIRTTKPDVALYYSKATRLYNSDYDVKLLNTYKALVTSGYKVGFVSEKSMDKLNDYKYLIIPGAVNAHDDAQNDIVSFMTNGGKVRYMANSFTRNKYNKKISNTWLTDGCVLYSGDTAEEIRESLENVLDKPEVVVYNNGETATDVEWNYDVSGEYPVVSISNLSQTEEKNLTVYYNGEQLIGMTDLLGGGEDISEITLGAYENCILTIVPEAPPEPEVPVEPEEPSEEIEFSKEPEIPFETELSDVSANKNSGTVTVRNLRSIPSYGICVIEFDNGKRITKNVLLDGYGESSFKFSISESSSSISVRMCY